MEICHRYKKRMSNEYTIDLFNISVIFYSFAFARHSLTFQMPQKEKGHAPMTTHTLKDRNGRIST